jgi:spore maturation protein CgeB
MIKILQSELTWKIKHYPKEKEIFGSFLSFDEMIKMYSRSKISLNFAGYIGVNIDTTDFSKAPKGLKGRDFEAPMSGAFYLTEHSHDITQIYKIGKEIETYKSVSELLNKIKYYLENADEAEAIRKAGRKRALEEYAWEKAFQKVFDIIGMKG